MVILSVMISCGDSGTDGTDGANGADGTDGVDGTDGTDGVKGDKGTDGADGTDGKDGEDGEDGEDGATGDKGADGVDGTDGEDGAVGDKGEDGADGSDGTDGEDGENGEIVGFNLVKPQNNSPITSDSYVTYALAEDVKTLSFIRTRISGSGPATDTVILTGADVTAGFHENVVLAGASLIEGDIYDIQIEATMLDDTVVPLTPVFALTVDNSAPVLEKARAIQTVFGEWNIGDRLIFTFSEPMDSTSFGGLSSLSGVTSNIADVSDNSYQYFSDASLSWSVDSQVLTLTLQAADYAVDVLYAGEVGSEDNALFNPTVEVRDVAGNSDNTPTDIELISTGDVTIPSIVINTPGQDRSTLIDPVIEFELSEDLQEGRLLITFQSGGSTDVVVTREWLFDEARLTKGVHTIDCAAEGITSLVDGAYYTFKVEGKDGADNKTSDEKTSVLADDTAPIAPDATKLFVRNYNNEVVIDAGETDGESGDYLRLYVDGSFTAQALFPAPYGKTEIQSLIKGLAIIVENASIGYSYIDEAGNESEITSDGIMPAAPTSPLDISKIGLRVGTTDYQLNNPTGLAANRDIYTALDQDPDLIFYSASTDGVGNCNPSSNAIPAVDISYGTEIYYLYRDSPSGHYSDYSLKDGTLEKLVSIIVKDRDGDSHVSPNDNIEVTMSGGVDIPSATYSISSGVALSEVGSYQWSAALQDLNVVPVSVGNVSSINAEAFWIYASGTDGSDYGVNKTTRNMPSGSNGFDIALNFSNFSVGNIEQMRMDFAPLGTNLILSYDGGHCVLPATQITPNGTTGGVISPDF